MFPMGRAAEPALAGPLGHDAGDGRLAHVDAAAAARFVDTLRDESVPHEVRAHEPARHARHLASIWGVPLHETARATLFGAAGEPVLAVVPADRKVSAPRFAAALGVAELRVLRGDRGVGRLGWLPLPGSPGALPAVPGVYRARLFVDELVLAQRPVVIALGDGCSARLAAADYARAAAATVARFAGTTRLLPGGGIVDEVAPHLRQPIPR
jgi:prolyl-tRNA editing enzyme YbaK/EbsC (Cys-tRNA(Pro) deacylase)